MKRCQSSGFCYGLSHKAREIPNPDNSQGVVRNMSSKTTTRLSIWSQSTSGRLWNLKGNTWGRAFLEGQTFDFSINQQEKNRIIMMSDWSILEIRYWLIAKAIGCRLWGTKMYFLGELFRAGGNAAFYSRCVGRCYILQKLWFVCERMTHIQLLIEFNEAVIMTL